MKNKDYNHKEIEKKWQQKWENEGTYSPDIKSSQKPFYNLFMFPYPSAEGLHAGHAMTSTGSDIYGRFKRMNGMDVLQPMGYDSFGIHSENYALKIGETPQEMLKRSTKHFEEQFKSFGHGYDWTHTLSTSNPDYYRWTQWVFLEFFKAGLAYKKKASVNFCPKDKTVLSDEQVMTPKQAGKDPIDAEGNPVTVKEGLMVCERCGTLVEKRELDVWFFRITDYAEKLLTNLPKINWSERVIVAQKGWIGKSEGIEIIWQVCDSEGKENSDSIVTFTTRKDTLPGVTFIVISTTSKYIEKLTKPSEKGKVAEYIRKSVGDNTKKVKSGVFTGSYAKNPFNNQAVPIYIADYVIEGYGTGAVMGMPGHDTRDAEFAEIFNLPSILTTDEKTNKQINTGETYDGLSNIEAGEKIFKFLETKKLASKQINYHLRDWGIGRQRYWGCPIPMIFCQKCADNGDGWIKSHVNKMLHQDQSDWDWQGWWPEEKLPVELPVIKDYKPEGNGRGPLANHPDFYEVACPNCGSKARRETDVADTFLDSSWYFLRYPSTDFNNVPFDPEVTEKWLPVDQYFGGAEHAVLHLMYSRFVTMVLHDLKFLSFEEPFPNFYAHGLMIKDGAKMSKSRGNVVNPDEYISKFGADTLRTYVVFMGPMDSFVDFRDTGIEGMHKFIKRVWELFVNSKEVKDEKELLKITHQTIQKVTKDIERFHYNTAISVIMEFCGFLKANGSTKESLNVLCQLIAPFAPHLAEEAWVEILGNEFSVHKSTWPKYISKYIKEDKNTIIIQVDGKFRSQLEVASDEASNKEKIQALALKDPKVQKWINGREHTSIFVPGKIINFVTSK